MKDKFLKWLVETNEGRTLVTDALDNSKSVEDYETKRSAAVQAFLRCSVHEN
jgi:hypothetical protein